MLNLLEHSQRKGAVSWSLINKVWTAYWTVGISRLPYSAVFESALMKHWILCYWTALWFISWPHTALLWIQYRFTALVLNTGQECRRCWHKSVFLSLKLPTCFVRKQCSQYLYYPQCENTNQASLCWESARSSNRQLGEHWSKNGARFQYEKFMFLK